MSKIAEIVCKEVDRQGVIPFADFFTASLSIKDVMKEIIVREGRPLTDREIVTRLRNEGIRVARRTVAKYREELRLPPSNLRKTVH